ncbi:MAG TPA: cyclodeaminase/cyclohydrolase family protein [Vicinamibacterales bacterium]|jgi:formiminotetrahydrofolate cyclodeaminase
MLLVERPLRELLAAFASSDPTPGGGSAAAAASAVGASLLMMVAGLPKTRSGSEAERTALASALIALTRTQAQLAAAIDADTAAYDQVVAAYKHLKGTPAEQVARKAAIQRALHAATDVPLNVMRLSTESLEHARAVAADGHRPAASDVGVAIALLTAGLQGARLNVETNLGSMSDAVYKDAVAAEVDRLMRVGDASAEAARSSLG